MSRVYMTNPGALLLMGNPARTKSTKTKAARRAAKAKKPKGSTMAKKPRTAAQKAATKRMLAANRAKRRATKAPKRAKRAAYAAPAKTRKAKRGKRSASAKKVRKAKRRARRSVKNVVASKGTTVNVRRVKRGTVRRAKKRSGRVVRRVRVNPAIGFLDGFTGFGKNMADVTKGGVKGWAFAILGAGGAVFTGTLLNRVTTPFITNIAPGLALHPLFARLWAASNAYLGGFLLAKFLPLDPRTKRAMLMGGTVSAVAELIKPGMVAMVIGKVPVVGPLFSGGVAKLDGLGEYTRMALNGYANVPRRAGVNGRMGAYYGDGPQGPQRMAGANSNRYDPSVVGGEALGCSFADQVISVATDDGTES